MQLDRIEVVLRPRSPWEAMELGIALVRRHARLLWRAWFILGLPFFLLFNALAWWLDGLIWAGLAMWWLKPLFDRVPLYLLSRTVFGEYPNLRQVLAAPLQFGWRSLLRDLTWARLSPVRSVTMPLRLLEGGGATRARKRVIVGSNGAAAGMTLVFLNFEVIFNLALISAGLLFVPVEFLNESARAMWSMLFEQPPKWAQLLLNLVAWLATSLIEPFYVGAGFAFYLNRRTQLEAWDLELAFRQMARRLSMAIPVVLASILLVSGLLPRPANAQQAVETRSQADQKAGQNSDQAPLQKEFQKESKNKTGNKASEPPPIHLLDELLPRAPAYGAKFPRSVARAYEDPLLRPTRTIREWKSLDKKKKRERSPFRFAWLDNLFGTASELLLWLGVGVLTSILLVTAPRWWPGLWQRLAPVPREDFVVGREQVLAVQPVPDDVPAAVRALWAKGQARAALALLYRCSVQRMVELTEQPLPPGATEAECLRLARALPAGAAREVFPDVVRVWQLAAYAQRLPGQEAFEGLLARASSAFEWTS